MRLRLILLLLFAILVACEPEPTPFPVDVPVTPTPTLSPTELPPLRYALAANTVGYVTDMDQIRSGAVVEQLSDPVNEADLGSRYDIVVSFGDFAGWTQTAILPKVILILNPAVEPFNADLLDVIRESINAEAVVNALAIPGVTILQTVTVVDPSALRAQFANLGYPDGLRVAMGFIPIPGVGAVANELERVNVSPRLVELTPEELMTEFEAGRLHLALVSVMSQEQRDSWITMAGAENVIDLYTLPISYLAVDGLSISLTPAGWPIIRRAS